MLMTFIFVEWFHDEFCPQVEAHLKSIGQEPKALLLLDNCKCHPSVLVSTNNQIKCVMLPPNTTSLIQPQDQGIIASVKKRYKSEILKRFFSSYSANRLDPNPLSKFYKDFTIKDVIFIIANIWETTPVATLKNA